MKGLPHGVGSRPCSSKSHKTALKENLGKQLRTPLNSGYQCRVASEDFSIMACIDVFSKFEKQLVSGGKGGTRAKVRIQVNRFAGLNFLMSLYLAH